MRVFHTMIFTISIISDSIDLGQQFDCLPNGDPIPGISRECPPSANGNNSSRKSYSGADFSVQDRPRSPPRLRSRSPPARFRILPARTIVPPTRTMVPPTWLPSADGEQCGLEELEFIRLIPMLNPNRTFQLRRYTFPADTPLDMNVKKSSYTPMPKGEQIVLSTSDGEVYAILADQNVLIGMYRYDNIDHNRNKRRAKVNMASEMVTALTKEEVKEVPVGDRRKISGCFIVHNIKLGPSQRQSEIL